MVRFGRGCFVRHFGRILWAAVGGKGLWNMFLFAFGTCLSIVSNLFVLQHILAGFCGLGFLLRTIFETFWQWAAVGGKVLRKVFLYTFGARLFFCYAAP